MKLKSVVWILAGPYKGLEYFELHYGLVEQIVLKRNTFLIWFVRTLHALTLVKAGHFLYLALSGSACCDAVTLWHTINYDGFYVLVDKPVLNLLGALATTLTVYMNHSMVEWPNTRLLGKLGQLLLHDNWSVLFLSSKDANWTQICAKLRKWHVRSVNIFQSINATYCM